MGGTLIKAREKMIETHLVVLTDGSRGGDSKDLVQIRTLEVRKQQKLLGIESLECWSEPDRFLEPSQPLITRACSKILQLMPKTVFFFQDPLRYIQTIELPRYLSGMRCKRCGLKMLTLTRFHMKLESKTQ